MNETDDNEASHTQVPGQSGLSDVPEKARIPQKNAVIDDEAAVPSDGKAVTQQKKSVRRREKAADSREDTAYRREETVTLREQVIHGADTESGSRINALKIREKVAGSREDTVHRREGTATLREHMIYTANTEQATSIDHAKMMQQANAQLVISAIEANKLNERFEAAQAQLDHLAHHDVLTGLPNRMLLADRLGQTIELCRRQGRKFAMLFIDLDRFKHINDSLGHTIGDELLKSVAQRIVSCVRVSDTVSRQGGDEFVVLLSHIRHVEDAAISARKILAALATPHLIEGFELHASASIGISTFPDDGQDAEILLKNADTAMYHAKDHGRKNYKFFEHGMNIQAVQRQSIEAGLHRALERQEFVLHYQPKINLHSNSIVGLEALIRWQHPERGLVPPLQFLPIAEDGGLILPIGRWVLRQACLQARAWRQAGLPPIAVAINTSALEFNAPDFLEYVRATLEETSLEPRYLELELTESVLMQDVEFTCTVLQGLADLGVKLAIDDFGTGYSSLSYLRRFPIDTLKIDQSFVQRTASNPDDAAIVSAIISLGKSLKLRVIAEGVETLEQHAFLLAQQCDEGQGYYFSRPMAAEILVPLLQAI